MKYIDIHQQQYKHQRPLIVKQNDDEDDDDCDLGKNLTNIFPYRSRSYLMAILLSCLITFSISLFIISLTLVWILSSQQLEQATSNNIKSNWILTNNLHQMQSNNGQITLIKRIKEPLLADKKSDFRLKRNSTKYLSSKQKLNKILQKNYPLNRLLNLNNFNFTINNAQRCQNFTKTKAADLNLVIVIHSAVEHFYHRQIIRNTWGKIRQIENYSPRKANIIIVFMLGISGNNYEYIQNEIEKESEEYDDLVQANFVDSYHNLTYKHLSALRWTVQYCPDAQFIFKIDDDAYLNIFSVIESLFNYYHQQNQYSSIIPQNLLACSLFPKNTKPKRSGKWSLSYKVYPHEYFPSYCSGVGYLLTQDIAFDLFEAAHNIQLPIIQIDDVFVTGLLTNALENIQLVSVNPLYIYDIKILRKWLADSNQICPNHIWIGDIGSEPDWQILAYKLWNKTEQTWKTYFTTNRCKVRALFY